MASKPVVLITGFGPFGKHTVNASWASIKQINIAEVENKNNIRLVSVEIPVVYKCVDDLVPSLWKKYDPILVIHVGVSDKATRMTLENAAHGSDYTRLDCNGVCPGENTVNKLSLNKIQCGLDVHKICADYNEMENEISACVSANAGRYLCEYTFYTSLKINASKALFVHVPSISGTFTEKNIAKGLESIIELGIDQLKKCGC